jgi:hypothetical protein
MWDLVFVRKQQPEFQCLKTLISEEQSLESGRLVGATIGQIEAAQFPSHSRIRFPQNGCVSCSHLGLCLDDQKLIDSTLIRTPGASNLAWLDELVDYGRIAVTPELNRRRAVFILGKIDEILSWEKTKEQEKDVRFVELGNTCARCAPNSIGAWRGWSRSMNFARNTS